MAISTMEVIDINKYWERLSASLSTLFSSLQGKAEYGTSASEKGVQSIVLFTAESIARDQNLNVNLVSSLCKAIAVCFPKKGFAELAIIKEFIKSNNVNIALETLEIDAIEYSINFFGSNITPELDMLLHKYYSDDESVPEVNLVRFLQKYLNLHRESLRHCSFSDLGRTVDAIMKKAEYEYKNSYRLLPDPYVTGVTSVPEDVKNEIEENIRLFIKYADTDSSGIYEFII